MSELDLFSAKFRQEREGQWQKLEQALLILQSTGSNPQQKAAAARELPRLSQNLNSALSVARAISLDRPMINYLESLASRTALLLNDEQPSLTRQFIEFFAEKWPRTMRALGWDIGLAAVIFFAGFAISYGLFVSDESWFFAFSGGDSRSPDASTEYLAETIDQSASQAVDEVFDGRSTGNQFMDLAAFSAFLFQNNVTVSFVALAGGLLFGMITLWALFFNGLHLGAFVALFYSRGLGTDLVGWLSIHGVTEIGAILVAGGGGLLIGRTMILVKGQSMAMALRAIGPKIAAVVLALVLMLGVAAIVEGFFRQTVTDTATRYFIGWGLGALWLSYFLFAGRERTGG